MADISARRDFGVFQHWVMDGSSSAETDRIGSAFGRGEPSWSILRAWTSRWRRRTSASLIETVDRSPGEGSLHAGELEAELAKAPACRRVLFETGRMAPMLYHGLMARRLPVVCAESRQAYQALKSLTTHKTDRNDARGLAHLARTGFFKPVHVKSLQAHAVRALVIARKKLVGQRATLENQIRGLAVVFGIRLPRALSPAFIDQALRASQGISGLSAAM